MSTLLSLDSSLSFAIYQATVDSAVARWLAPLLGVYLVYLLPIVLIWLWLIGHKKPALHALLVGLVSWRGIAKLVAYLLPRARPSQNLIGVQELVFHRPDASFPSDHLTFMISVAVALYLAREARPAWLIFALAGLTAISRVALGVHYVGDVLVGALIGAVMALILERFRPWLDKRLYQPITQGLRRWGL